MLQFYYATNFHPYFPLFTIFEHFYFQLAGFTSRINPAEMSLPMTNIHNGNGSTFQMNRADRPDDIRNRIIGGEFSPF